MDSLIRGAKEGFEAVIGGGGGDIIGGMGKGAARALGEEIAEGIEDRVPSCCQ